MVKQKSNSIVRSEWSKFNQEAANNNYSSANQSKFGKLSCMSEALQHSSEWNAVINSTSTHCNQLT